MADRTVLVRLQGDASSLVAAANQGRNALNELGRADTSRAGAGIRAAGSAARESTSAFDKMKSSIGSQVGIANIAAMGIMAGFFAVKAAIMDTIKATTDYQTTLFTLQAVTHANGATMVDVAAKARELGKDMSIPNASATDAAKAMTELAKGGLSVGQSMTAAKGTLLLAAAATVTASQAAEVEVNTLNAFHLSADAAGHVSDVLANAANQASGEMMDFANGLKMVGATAHGFGISLEDTVTVLGLFANAGIKSEMGGTLLNTMLLRLAAPTKHAAEEMKTLGLTTFDAQGNFVGMRSITDQLRAAHERLTPAVYDSAAAVVFGTRGIRGAMILGAEAADSFGLMAAALHLDGGAADLAAAKMAGLRGAFENIQNQVQDTQLAIGLQLAPALTALGNGFAGVIQVIGEAVMWFGNLPGPIKLGAAALGAWILLKGPITSLFDTIAIKAMLAADNVTAAGGIMRASMAGVEIGAKAMWTAIGGWVGLGIAAITTAFTLFAGTTKEVTQSTSDFTGAIDDNTGALAKNAAGVISKASADSGSAAAYEKIGGKVADYTAALLGSVDAQNAVHTQLLDAATAGVEASTVWGQVSESMIRQGKTSRDVASGLLAAGDAGKYTSDQMYAALDASNVYAQDSQKLSDAQKKVKDALDGSGLSAGAAVGAVDSLSGSVLTLNDVTAAGLDPAKAMNDAMKEFKNAADFATTAGDFLWASLQDLAGNFVSAEARTRLANAAIRDMAASQRDLADANATVTAKQQALTDAVNKYGADSPQAAQASRDLAAANDAVAKASDSQAASIAKAGEEQLKKIGTDYGNELSTKGVTQATADAMVATDNARNAFIQAELQINGGNIPAARALADQYGLVPGTVATTFLTQGGQDAVHQVDTLNAALDAANNRVIRYKIIGTNSIEYLASNPGGASTTDYLGVGGNAAGGLIRGPGTGTSDSILARLSDGEFVVKAAAAGPNLPLLHAINDGYAAGGRVSVGPFSQGPSSRGPRSQSDKRITETVIQENEWSTTKSGGISAVAPPAGGSPYTGPISGGVGQWTGMVLRALAMTGQSLAWVGVVLHQMETESSGNPNAINLTDINAQRGTPSIGLLQVIGPTFRSYALPGFDQNIYDPLSNIIAAIRYTVATYGSLPAGMRGVAYGTGGIVGGHGTGDTQPAWLTPGEAVISRAGGYKDRNKAYVDTAAGWFGGKVMYPGDGHLPPHVGATTVNVAAPVVTVNTYLDGAQIASRTELIVDGKFVDFKNDLNRAVGQAVV